MAGRPVSARGGLTGLHYGLIFFAIAAVAALGGFIFQLTRVQDLMDRAATAERRAQQFGSAPSYYMDEATARGTSVADAMSRDLRELAQLVVGSPGAVAPTIVAQAQSAVGAIAAQKPGTINAGDTLLTALTRLSELHTEARQSAEATAAELADRIQEVESLNEQLKAARDQYESAVAALQEQLRRAETEKTEQIAAKDTQLSDLQATLETAEQQVQQLRRTGLQSERQKDLEIARLGTQIASLQQMIQDLKPSSFDPNAILTKSDGRILRAVPGSDVCYINLGSRDKIKAGMGFEVYSQTREVPKGLRGKASIEVVTALDDTAECRITRTTPSQPILEGDIIVNIAYERGRLPKFLVTGDFDLNYDGVIDFDGVDKVAARIREFGGQVVRELDESTDFVVIGLAPQGPQFAPDAQVSDVVRDQAQRKALEESRFRELVARAQSMYIPVITQNQFLFLTGYAGQQAITRR